MAKRFLIGAAALIVLAISPARAQAATDVRNVLILQSFERGYRVFDRFTDDFRTELAARAAGSVTVTQFVVTPAGFAESPEESILAYLRSTFVNESKPDLVVTVGGPAAAFARRHRQTMFPDTPLLYAAVERRFLGPDPLAGNEAAAAVTIDYEGMINEIVRLRTGTGTVMMVTGTGPLSQFWRPLLERRFQQFGNLTFIWTDALTYAEVIQRASSLPPQSAIVYFAGGTFADRGWRSEDQALKDLSERATAPLFGIHSVWLGMGIVGGTLLFTGELGPIAADAAIRILGGASPAAIGTVMAGHGERVFDARQLRRWNIPEGQLPAGSQVRFREPSLWRDYRAQVLAAIGALAFQSLLIASLIYQRQGRRRAEVQSRANLGLAAEAERRATVSAMTGSIAHELSQPLNAIQHNAQAGEMLIGGNRATPEALKEILTDIRAANVRAAQIVERHRVMIKHHTLELQPIDLHGIVGESVAFVDHDISAKQVQIDVDAPASACMVRGDRVLLQQVLVNLIMNAVDAMESTPPEKRRITLRSHVRSEAVELSLRDTGSGLSSTVSDKVFEPFVTTKSNGLGIGLTIARAIVDSHRGSITACNNPDRGATFTITLPCERTSAGVSAGRTTSAA